MEDSFEIEVLHHGDAPHTTTWGELMEDNEGANFDYFADMAEEMLENGHYTEGGPDGFTLTLLD